MDNDASLRTCCCVNPILVSALICAMDPKTVVIMLAINLIFSGLLYHLIARRVRAESGLNHLSLGGILFGIAYMGRLFLADSSGNSIAPVADVHHEDMIKTLKVDGFELPCPLVGQVDAVLPRCLNGAAIG